MSRRWIQNLCIVIVFLAGFVTVVFLGANQGTKNFTSETDSISLGEKIPWEDAIPDPSEDPTVYVTKSGTKYHLYSDCSGLSRAKEIIKTTLSAATKDGKDLCKICEG